MKKLLKEIKEIDQIIRSGKADILDNSIIGKVLFEMYSFFVTWQFIVGYAMGVAATFIDLYL